MQSTLSLQHIFGSHKSTEAQASTNMKRIVRQQRFFETETTDSNCGTCTYTFLLLLYHLPG